MPSTAKSRKNHRRARFWCWTWNNYEFLPTLEDFNGYGRYLVYSEEIGEEGTPHLQGYVELTAPKSMLAMKQFISQGVSWRERKGTAEQAAEYCKKKDHTHIDGPYEYGRIGKGQGSRTDLLMIQDKLDKGVSLKDIAKEHFPEFVRYHKGIERYVSLNAKKKDWITEIQVVIGETSSGKTTFTKAKLVQGKTYWKDSTKWWPFYEGDEETVVFDEFVGCWSPYEVNRMWDPNPYAVEPKNSHFQFVAKQMVFCSNYHPKSWWSKSEYWPAFERRVKKWWFCWRTKLNGLQFKYEQQGYDKFDEFADRLDKEHVPNKPVKDDK